MKCKKVFLLTDGEVSKPEKVVKLASRLAKRDFTEIYTFGIGRDCSIDLVQKVAKAGHGTCSLVPDEHKIRS